MPSDSDLKTELLQRIEQMYAALMQFVNSLDEGTIVERLAEDEWSVKDILAHVAAWENILLRFHLAGERFEAVIGVPGVQYRVTPFDEINHHLFKAYCNWTVQHVKGFAAETHNKLMDRLAQMSTDDLRKSSPTMIALGFEADPLTSFIAGNTYEHYAEHLDAMQRVVDRAS